MENYFQIIENIKPRDLKIPDLPNDRDYFIDSEENIYQVLGYVHLPQSIHSLLKYKWVKEIEFNPENHSMQMQNFQDFEDPNKPFYWFSRFNRKFYKRFILNYSAETAIKNIEQSKYKQYSKIYGTDFILFPREKVKYYLSPLKKFESIIKFFSEGKWDAISKAPEQMRLASEFGLILEDFFNISLTNLGITGSMLWDGLHKFSDIDIIIYGLQSTWNFIKNAPYLPSKDKRIRKPNISELFSLGSKFSIKSGIPVDDCIVFSSIKPYLFYYGKYFLSIAFCPTNNEIKNNPLANAETKFINLFESAPISINAKVLDDSWSLYYPSLTYITDVEILDKKFKKKIDPSLIKRILVFERETTGYYFKNNKIRIKGLLQKVINPPNHYLNDLKDSDNSFFYQIVIGTAENFGNEYVINLDKK
ncbi:MAG: hypothetical protein ACTSRZ_06125 [Promethearchaeota archaeon]